MPSCASHSRGALATIESMNVKVTTMNELMLQGQGAKVSRWIGPGLSAVIAFSVSQLGGFIHRPK
ncbi:hypothetical protein [Microvirga vignae]|uniref:hypothetical protein n=1 Tax=Microvirga vignae TaxID=1225564 RepID=UPI001364DD4B|nr:hypothetical protein [Microvirga vignae]